MNKEFFIKSVSESKGGHKAVLKKMGLSVRYLDRFKYKDELPVSFVERYQDMFESKKTKDKKIKEARKDSNQIGLEISNADYHASENMGSSKIKMIIDSPFEFKRKYVEKVVAEKKTEALIVGSVHHTLVLEPEKLKTEYVLIDDAGMTPKDALVKKIETLGGAVTYKENGKGVSELVSELKDMCVNLESKEKRTIISMKHIELATITANKALRSRFVVDGKGVDAELGLILQSHKERVFVERTFYGEIGGVKFQVRPDILLNLGSAKPVWFCIDLKTAENASMPLFLRQSAGFYYDIQQWIYCEILRQNGIDVIDFRFLVAGKDENSNSAYYKIDNEDIEDAGTIVLNAVKKYLYCLKNDDWSDGRFDYKEMKFEPVSTVKLPTWRKFAMNDMGVFDTQGGGVFIGD